MRLSAALRLTFFAGTATAMLSLLPAGPAAAHAQLLRTDPANGASVPAALSTVTLTFNEQVQPQFSTVVVTGADGVSYSDGPPRAGDRSLTQPVKALPAGEVRVSWRAVAIGGHPMEGQFTFTSGTETATVTAPAPAAATPSSAVAAGAGSGAAGLVWAGLGGVLLVVAGAGLWRRRRAG